MIPDEDAHPRLRELWDESSSALMVWRMRYNLPPNDPRVVDITDDELFEDLLRLAYYDLRQHARTKPAVLEMAKRGRADAYRKAIDEAKDDPSYAAMIAAVKGKPPPATPAADRATTKRRRWSPFGGRNG
jgi:hypothetical protein